MRCYSALAATTYETQAILETSTISPTSYAEFRSWPGGENVGEARTRSMMTESFTMSKSSTIQNQYGDNTDRDDSGNTMR